MLSRNIIRLSLPWTSYRVHVVNLRISRRSASRYLRNMGSLAEIALAVIMILPSLVTVSETK